jgi:hypothetical protein
VSAIQADANKAVSVRAMLHEGLNTHRGIRKVAISSSS